MTSRLLLGCIGDDFTGSTDLANTLVRNGMRTVQLLGVPDENTACPEADAIVIALKSRTAPVTDAVAESLASALGCAAAVVDVNDIDSAVLGQSRGVDPELVRQALKDNPLGQGAEQTPLGLLRPQ